MKTAASLALRHILPGGVIAVMVCFVACPTPTVAQGTQGQDAVYNSASGIVGSSSFVDASTFVTSGDTICSAIYHVLSSTIPPYPSAGAVIDARGLNSGNVNMTCASGWTPWNNGMTVQNKPSTILLPATGGATPTPIIISTPWILPSNTHLIGEGDGIPSSGSTPGTAIRAASGFSGSMIQFGAASPVCLSNVCSGIYGRTRSRSRFTRALLPRLGRAEGKCISPVFKAQHPFRAFRWVGGSAGMLQAVMPMFIEEQ